MGFEPTVLAGTPDFKCRLLFLKRTQRILQGPSEVPLRFLLSLSFLPFFERCPVRMPCRNTGRKAIHKSQRKILSDGGVGSIDGKTPPCLPESPGAAGRPTGSSFLIASEFESPQLEKSAFCIFFVLLSSDAANYLEIAFFATFPAEIFE